MSPARDVPRIDPATVDVERLAQFLFEIECGEGGWEFLTELSADMYRDEARKMVRRFDELEEILSEILVNGRARALDSAAAEGCQPRRLDPEVG